MFYNYLFYSIYKFTLKTPKKDDPVFMTVFMMILPIGANISAIYLILEKMFSLPELTSFFMGGLALALVTLNYLIFWRKDCYKLIVEEIESSSENSQKKWKTIMILYFLLTTILFFAIAYLKDFIPFII